MAKEKIGKFGIFLLLFLYLSTGAYAYITNGTEKAFGFAITSGADYYTKGGDFSTWIVIGDISSTLNSSNFRTELGFLRTTGYIVGESCDTDNDCPGGSCCSNKCKSSCPSQESTQPSTPTPHTSSVGSGITEIPKPIPENSFVQFFDSIKANQELSLSISRVDLPVTEITFTPNQDLDSVTLSLLPVGSPQFTINNAYFYFEITSDKLNQDNLAAFIVKFKVRIDSGYIKDTISLNRYSNDWVGLPTSLIEEDSQYYYYESNVREFSLFAIAGRKASPLIEEKEPEIEAPKAAEEEKIVEAAALKEEPKPRTMFLGLVILILLFFSIPLLAYYYPKLRYIHFKSLNSKFNNLLHKAKYYVKKNRPAEAKEAYQELVSDYEQLGKYQTDRQFWFHIKSLIDIYKKIVRLTKSNLRGDSVQKEFRKRVHDYIKENLDNGYSLKSIKENFIQHGYPKKFTNRLIYRYELKKFAIKSGPLFLVTALLLLSAVFFYKPGATTYAIITKGYNFTDNIGLTFNESSEYTWILENNRILKSVRLNGEVKESGNVKIYLRHENQTYLVFSRELLEKASMEEITGFTIKEDKEKNKNEKEKNNTEETPQNETQPINETPALNGTLPEINITTPSNETLQNVTINETVPLNETINITPTINETIQNETINTTIPLNETPLTNETANISTRSIGLAIEYKKDSLYDKDDNGVENINSIVDLTVENSKFSWDADKENLCTRWDIYPVNGPQSTMVCYGSRRCCEFADLSPKRDSWNETYYASHGKDGADLHNTVSAQLLYVDYNLSPSKPYVDIHYSEWKNLTVEFYEEFTKFSGICAETCILPELNGTAYQLVIEIRNSSLILSSISYQILRPEVINTGPILLKNFSDITIYKDQSLAINLSEYFHDEDNDTLKFSYYSSDLNVSIVNETAILSTSNFTGATHIFFIANDSRDTTLSNIFKIEVEAEERKEMPKTLKSLRRIIGI